MCGIAGFVDRGGRRNEELQELLGPMVATLAHRGPDDSGSWIDPEVGVALGHRRLKIIDLSELGHQPMASDSGRFVLDYNGEVYNFHELRSELEARGRRFKGTSDTEVLVCAMDEWGIEEALSRCNGMFALAVWDRKERVLTLARDRFGEKPLYYGWAGDCLVFASELKALRAHRDFVARIDRGALALYARHNCVPGPHCIYRGVKKLPPATLVRFGERTAPGGWPDPLEYWSIDDMVARAQRSRGGFRATEALDGLEHALLAAVGRRMHADVPLGAFLSGGIDSSLVVALMQAQTTRKVRTFTMAFDDPKFDEGEDSARVASHLGTEHLEMLVTPKEALEAVPKMPAVFDEPFADSSQVPTYLLAALTREHVTVAMSGDGGDELFGGYNRYLWANNFWGKVGRVPRSLRVGAASAIGRLSPGSWDALFARAEPFLPRAARIRMPGNKLAKVAEVLPSSDLHEVYVRLASHVQDPSELVLGASESPTRLTDEESWPDVADPVELMMFLDTVTYLPDDILTKVDRATMAVSLEARVPYLDPEVAELAWRFPIFEKVKRGKGKWPLRSILYRYVPEEIVERPKMGFGWPVGEWLAGPLRPWALELIDPVRLRREGYFDADVVTRMWRDQVSGRRDVQYQLWDVLMFQSWLESNGAGASG